MKCADPGFGGAADESGHFNATYENSELVVGISPLRIIQGDAPLRVRAMVLDWAARQE